MSGALVKDLTAGVNGQEFDGLLTQKLEGIVALEHRDGADGAGSEARWCDHAH